MSPLICTVALAVFQYGFAPGTRLDYKTSIELSGFIPILGGNEGTALVRIDLRVEGLDGTKPGELRASSEITGFSATFNEANVPLDAASVQNYFPKTTIRLAPTGKVIESDAPDIKLPVRLPGLDVKRFPDITYVPIEFPEKGMEVGESWKFTKLFGESEIKYECRLLDQADGLAKIEVSLLQEFEVLEDAALEITTDRNEAERKVKTTMTGLGLVVFDTRLGVVKQARVVSESVSVVTELGDGGTNERRLTTTIDLRLKEEAVAPQRAASPSVVRQIKSAWASIKLGAQIAWRSIVSSFSLGG